MARVGGRNRWFAVPAGLLCIAIVATLVWLSLPMVPVTVAWAGDALRRATAPHVATPPPDTPAMKALAGGAVDCRDIYSDGLWGELTWHGRTLLDQSADAPATAVTSLTEVLAPEVVRTCRWTGRDDGEIRTTIAVVGPDAASLADAALRGQGFSCATDDGNLRCTSTQGGTTESHVVRDGLWLSVVERSWHPDDYVTRVEARVWG